MAESTVSSSSDQPNPQKRPHPQIDRQQVLDRLCSLDGGFGVVCATVATLYQFQPTESTAESAESNQTEAATQTQWKVIGYGIPAVVAEKGSLVLSLGDLESGTDVHQLFALQSTSQYTALDEHFHVFLVHPRDSDEVQCYGLGFSDVAVAKKILYAVKQLIPCTDSEADKMVPPPSKRSELAKGEDDDWVVIEREDIPVLTGDSGGTDATDSALWSSIRRKKSQNEPEAMEIGKPTDFKHIAHVGKDTPIGKFTRVISGDVSESTASTEPIAIKKPEESGTEISSSFEAKSEAAALPPPPAPPPPQIAPPPPAFTLPRSKNKPNPKKQMNAKPAPTFGISLEEVLIKSATLRPVGNRSKTLPRPPPKPERTRLVYEIHTFTRTTLRHVSPKSKDSTDSHDEPLSIQSLLKAGLEKMKNKLQNMTVVGNINSEGEEEGFEDEFDGALFVEE